MSEPLTALPSVAARATAFVAIIVAGLLGAVIGYSFIDLQCDGSCTIPAGFAMLAGTTIASTGVAVIAVLSLRAIGEWSARSPEETAGDLPTDDGVPSI